MWQINAEEVGEYPGRIWLYAQPGLIMPHSEDLLLSEPLTMQVVNFRVASILGLGLEFTKLLGVGGLALGGRLLADLLIAILVIVAPQNRKERS